MAKIKNKDRYPEDVVITDNDYLIGTDADESNRTKNFPIKSIAQYIASTANADTSFIQNNKVIEIDALDGLNQQEPVVSQAVNLSTNFTINGDEIFFIHNQFSARGTATTLITYRNTYIFKKGKGVYGLNSGVTLVEEDFLLIKSIILSSIPIDSGLPPKVEYITAIDITDPSTAINTSSDNYDILNNRDTYFVIQSTSKAIPRPKIIYRFVGGVGTYGLGGTATVEGDFLLVEDLSNTNTINDVYAVQVLIDTISGVTATNVQEALEQIAAQENNFSRNIEVTSIDLASAVEPTLEEQLVTFVNALTYDKGSQDSEVWVDYKHVPAPLIDYLVNLYTIGGEVRLELPEAENLNSFTYNLQVVGKGTTGNSLSAGTDERAFFGAVAGDTFIFTNVRLTLQVGSALFFPDFTLIAPTEGNTVSKIITTVEGSNGAFTKDKKYRIINTGKGILNIALENLQRVGYDITAATTSLDPTNLTVAPEVELQAFTETIDKAVLRARGTGVSASYDASVAVGGTTFTLGDVEGEINGDQGFFNVDSAAESNISVSNLTVGDTFVYIDNTGQRQQQTSEPTREDWVRKVFTMRIAVDTVSQTILGFEFLNNPIGHYANSIRDIYKTLIAQGVPFKEDQIVTGRASDLGFDISAGTLLEFGGTGNIYKPNTKDFPLIQNAPFFLSTRTAFDAGGNTALPKFWDNNGTLTPLGSTTLVGHRLYRFSNGNIVIQYGQGNYANMSLAKVGVRLEEYVLNPKLKKATLFGWWFIESTATNTSGTTLTDFVEYTLGIQGGSSNSLSGCLLKGNNLSDLLDVSAARTNLGAASTAQGVLADTALQPNGTSPRAFKNYYNSKTEAVSLPVGGKILVQTGTDEPERIDVDLLLAVDAYSQDTAGSIITFDKPRNFGNISLLNGSITFDFTDASFMATAFVAHRSASLNLPLGSIITQGTYAPNEVNYIQFVYISDSKILVYYSNIADSSSSVLNWTNTGAGFLSVTSTEHKLRNLDAAFSSNYAISSETFQKGKAITLKLLPIAPSTTAKLFVAFVSAVGSTFANVYSGFTIRGNEARFWNGTNTTFALTLTDINAKFTIGIDQDNNCRFTSDIDGDFIAPQNVPDGAFVQIYYADENGTDPAFPIGSADDFDVFDIAKVNI